MKVLVGRKLGMSRVSSPEGKSIPVTVLAIPENVVTQIKTFEKDGYAAIQVGAGHKPKITKPLQGHLKTASATSALVIERPGESALKPGEKLSLEQFEQGESISIAAVSKGKGYSGVIKRHKFHRGPQTHGSDHHRATGSIGSMFPQRVIPGRKMPGHKGHENTTLHKRTIIELNSELNTIAIKGPIPGPRKGWVVLWSSI